MGTVLPLPRTAETVAEKVVAASKRRWLALDLLRFTAVVLMVQGHLFYVVLDQALRAERWYSYHAYVHGFTAPLFLFASGAAFGITTLNKWSEHTAWGKPVAKRFERYLIIIAIGYALHLGRLELSWLLELPSERLMRATRVDALQHIGVTLLIVEALALLLKRKALFLGVVGALGIAAVASAPWVWNWDLSGLPIPLAAYVNASTGSVFPLVPWAGFIALGVVTAAWVQRRRDRVPFGLRQLAVPLAVASVALVLMGHGLARSGWDPFPEHNFWKTSPWFFMVRAGVIFGVLAALCAVDVALRDRQRAPAVRVLQVIGSQTLVIYVAHLMVLYGSGVAPGLGARWDRNLGLVESSAMAAALLLAMGLLAWLWDRTKRQHPVAFERVRYAVTAALVLAFLLR